ncbi:hypothetical protein ACKLNQ_12480 [Myroides odoratimimus]|uniref:hypothetical protein n=1 Tax=Myroides odoratimimus TaxID=76832 RepID=UPI0038D3DA22
MELQIINVGQGNWNVLKMSYSNLFYDLGTCKNENESNIKKNIIDKNSEFFDKPFGVVISHWDVDHYRLIISLEKDKKLGNVMFFVCPENRPTLTAQKAYNIIKKTTKALVFEVPNLAKGSIIGRRGETPYKRFCDNLFNHPLLQKDLNAINYLFGSNNSFFPSLSLYHSVERKNRNKNSLILVLNYSVNDYVIFTGDSYYRDLDNYVLSGLDPNMNNIYLIVPHHGGAAGKFMLNNLSFKTAEAFISVGKNHYGHPLKKNINYLEMKFSNYNVFRTDSPVPLSNIVRIL